MALSMIADRGIGVLLYEQQEGRGIGLDGELRAMTARRRPRYRGSQRALGFKADQATSYAAAEMLKALESEVRLPLEQS